MPIILNSFDKGGLNIGSLKAFTLLFSKMALELLSSLKRNKGPFWFRTSKLIIRSVQLNNDVNEDTCTWSLGPNGTFTVKDARYRIDQNILPTLAHATTWDKSIPRKVNVFMWRLSLDRLPHRLNLSSRDIATDMWKLVFRW
ncbi:hypothetical protein Tco_0624685 [Tanacetum coccineum]|uniref:Reverse transcriptase zinc-binding domain-containing protein n=1 Tax=Tanacetum coccineum TaxID=301880 RepID=A0ABQ4WER3_9ASTR